MEINKTQLGFADGWKVIYQARTVFAILLLVALLANLAIFFTAKFTTLTKDADFAVVFSCLAPQHAGSGYLCKLNCPIREASASKTILASTPTTASAPAQATASQPTRFTPQCEGVFCPRPPIPQEPSPETQKANKWYLVFSNVMNMTAIVSLVSIFFMVFCALAGMVTIIAGRLPGAGLITSAFFWAVGIIILMLPWSNFIPQADCLPIGIPDFADIHAALRQTCSGSSCSLTENLAGTVQLWVRFVVFPLIIILIDIVYLTRTRQAANDIHSLATPTA